MTGPDYAVVQQRPTQLLDTHLKHLRHGLWLWMDDEVWHESGLEAGALVVGDGDACRPCLAGDPLDDEGPVVALQCGRVGPRGRRHRARPERYRRTAAPL